MSNQSGYITVCTRCNGSGRYDRGACFGCKNFGSLGWTRKPRKSKTVAQVTAIRDEAEGRLDWIKVYNATAAQAVEIVQRQMRVAGTPSRIIKTVEAKVL